MKYNGIDVSELQGDIDWASVSSSGIEFAMIRATYDSSGVDCQFVQNIYGISKTDIDAGAYHESSAQSVNEAVSEANNFLDVIKPYNFSYPLALQIESEVAMQTGKEFFTNIILAFLDVVKNAGYCPLLYARTKMLEKNIDVDRIPDTDIWLADLTNNPEACPNDYKNITIWQYSNRGNVQGTTGNINLNVSYVNYPEVIKRQEQKYHLDHCHHHKIPNHYDNNTSIGADSKMNSDNNANLGTSLESDFSEPYFYIVEKGDTLRSIANKFLGNPEQYKSIMDLNGLNRPVVFAGQTLRIPQNIDSNVILHRVQAGDTLWKISERFLGYGPRYSEIMNLNGLTTDMIYPGQIIKIQVDNNLSRTYTVQPGDTLWKIAQNLLGNGNRYTSIMALNGLQNGSLTVGQTLKIPSK